MYCPKCGTFNDDKNRFCGNCGTVLISSATPTQPSQQPPTQQAQAPYTQQPPMMYPPMMQQPMPQDTASQIPGNGLAIASLVLGICSLVFFCLSWIALIVAIVGIILGAIAINKAKKAGRSSGMALAGVICSSIAIVVIIVYIIILVAIAATTSAYAYSTLYDYGYYYY